MFALVRNVPPGLYTGQTTIPRVYQVTNTTIKSEQGSTCNRLPKFYTMFALVRSVPPCLYNGRTTVPLVYQATNTSINDNMEIIY